MPYCQFDAGPLVADEVTPPRILVVDDDEMVRNVLRLALQRKGFDVTLAADGQEALDLFKRDGTDISAVLLDVCMPGLDGPQTMERLQQIDPDMPVYFMTAGSANYGEHDLVRRGALQVFQKPFDLNEVTQALRTR
jgi:DNA-binding NtrC family response regulator